MTKRRRRCTRCNALSDPNSLQRVGMREEMCPGCLLEEAMAIAPPVEVDADGVILEPADDAPEPLAMPTEEERFAGFAEADVEGWPLRKGRLSASALACYMTCPEQFRRKYVLGERTATLGKMLAGTAAHATVEATIRHALAGNGLATAPQLAATYDASFDQAVESAASRGGVEWGSAEKRPLDGDTARQIGRDAVQAYALEGLPMVLASGVVGVEETFALEVPLCPVPIVGLVDVAGVKHSVDLKFGEKSASRVQPYWVVQARVYGLARRLPVDFHTATWAGKVQTEQTHPGLRFAWDAAQAVLAARMIADVCRSILDLERLRGRDSPWPGTLTSTFCPSCDFRPDCAWWNLQPGDLL